MSFLLWQYIEPLYRDVYFNSGGASSSKRSSRRAGGAAGGASGGASGGSGGAAGGAAGDAAGANGGTSNSIYSLLDSVHLLLTSLFIYLLAKQQPESAAEDQRLL